jgi:hypothetical protein
MAGNPRRYREECAIAHRGYALDLQVMVAHELQVGQKRCKVLPERKQRRASISTP